MVKKSNKTSHVLNLITNRTGISPEELEQAALQAAEAPQAPPPAQFAQAPPVQYAQAPPVWVAQAPQAPPPARIMQAPQAPSRTALDISDVIRENLEKVQIKEAEEQAAARKARMEEKRMKSEAKARNIQPIVFPHISAEPRIENFTPESFSPAQDGPEEKAECEAPEIIEFAETSQPAEREAVSQSMDGFVLVNILEEVVRMETPKIMAGLGMCCCDRCLNDVMALTLNNIPAKYVVSRKGALFAKIASYGNQYKTDILASVTQACVLVQKTPSHS